MKTNVAVILSGSDYEWLFINGKLIDNDHSINRPEDWVKWTNEYGITSIERYELNEEDETYTAEHGYLPDELTGDYKGAVKGFTDGIYVDKEGNKYEYLGVKSGRFRFKPLGDTEYSKSSNGTIPFSFFPYSFKLLSNNKI